jgi:hypothetical protein
LWKDTLELQPNGGFLTGSSFAVDIISFRLCEEQDEFHKPTVFHPSSGWKELV